MKKLWEEFQYFFQQKIYVIILCLTAICGYGFEMTHPSIGIDDTAVSLYLEDGLEVVMGRWFIYLINKIFHLSDFSPFMMELIGVILLCISATLFCVLFRRIFGRKVGLTGYIIFSCIFISNPIISEVYVYYYHDGVDIGYVFSALALICFWSGMDKWSGTRKSAIKYYLGSLICITVAIGCYESMLLLFVIGILLLLYLRAFTDNRRLKSGYVIGQLIIGASITLGVIILRSVILKVMIRVFRLQDMVGFMNQRSITEVLKIFGSNQPIQELWMLLKRFWIVYYVNAVVYLPILGYVIATFVLGMIAVVLGIRRKDIWYLLLLMGMMITPFLLTIVEGRVTLYRSCQYMPFFTGIGFLLLYLFFSERRALPWLRPAYLVLTGIMIYNQAAALNQAFYVDYNKYLNTKEVLTEIALEIERDYGKSTPVIFTGHYSTPYSLVEDYYVSYGSWQYRVIATITDKVDPHLKEKYFAPQGYCFTGEANYPFIQWAFDAFDGTNREMMNFLEMHGHSFPQVTDPEILEQARTIGDTMPEWPADGSVSLQDGYILVHI